MMPCTSKRERALGARLERPHSRHINRLFQREPIDGGGDVVDHEPETIVHDTDHSAPDTDQRLVVEHHRSSSIGWQNPIR